jgi:hypothetical protein
MALVQVSLNGMNRGSVDMCQCHVAASRILPGTDGPRRQVQFHDARLRRIELFAFIITFTNRVTEFNEGTACGLQTLERHASSL